MAQNVRVDYVQVALQHSTDRHRSKAEQVPSTAAEVCEGWVELVKHYKATTRTYDDAITELSSVPGGEFNIAWMRCERLRRASTDFRAALLEHEHEHGCSNRIELNPLRR
jgi:hypothetical protein